MYHDKFPRAMQEIVPHANSGVRSLLTRRGLPGARVHVIKDCFRGPRFMEALDWHTRLPVDCRTSMPPARRMTMRLLDPISAVLPRWEAWGLPAVPPASGMVVKGWAPPALPPLFSGAPSSFVHDSMSSQAFAGSRLLSHQFDMVPRVGEGQEWLVVPASSAHWDPPGLSPAWSLVSPAKTVVSSALCPSRSQENTSPTSGVGHLSRHDTRSPLNSLLRPFLTRRQEQLFSPCCHYNHRPPTSSPFHLFGAGSKRSNSVAISLASLPRIPRPLHTFPDTQCDDDV